MIGIIDPSLKPFNTKEGHIKWVLNEKKHDEEPASSKMHVQNALGDGKVIKKQQNHATMV